MRLVAFADTHGQYKDLAIPDGDILVFAGDAGCTGNFPEMVSFANWFSHLPHKHKVFIAGNHDGILQKQPWCTNLFEATYLQDSGTDINGVKIYGAPWTPLFNNWAFMLERGPVIKAKWDRIPAGLDVLITHGPPFCALDRNARKVRCGCQDLNEAVRWARPKLHIFGHIHNGYGKSDNRHTVFANVSMLDDAYNLSGREPMVFEV